MSFIDDKIDVDVIGFGALNLDKLFYVNNIAHEDDESFIKESDVSCGGSAANTIIGLSKLGLSVSYIGKIADDEEGELLEMNLISEGVFVNNLIVSEKGHSGRILGFIDEEGERALYVDPGVNDEITMNEIAIDKVLTTKILHYSSFVGDSLKTQIELLDSIPESILLSFDPGHLYAKKGIKSIEKILNRTNILLINEIELKMLFEDYYKKIDGLNDNESLNFREIAIHLLNDGIENVIIKRGNKGVYAINNQNEEVKIPSFECDVIDTTAAGDSFNSGFLYSYIQKYSLEKSCLIGNWIASKCVEDLGINGLPDLDDLKNFEKNLI